MCTAKACRYALPGNNNQTPRKYGIDHQRSDAIDAEFSKKNGTDLFDKYVL